MGDFIKLIGFAGMLGTATLTVSTRLNNIDKKIDVMIATNKGTQDVMETKLTAVRDQVSINTLTIKTLADFVKPESPRLKRYRE